MDPLKLKKLEKLAKVLDNGDIALLTELDALESRLEGLETIVPALREAKDGYTPVKGVDYRDGVDGYTPIKGVDYFDGEKGADGRDGKDSTVPGPRGEKGEPGESIVGPAGRDGNDGFVDEATIAYLEEEVKKAKLDKEAYDRALGTLDQRTQFSINKASNLERDKITGVGVSTIYVSATAPSNPSTSDLWIDTEATPSGGSSAWGAITGNLSDQTDLQTALGTKAASDHVHTGVYEPADATILKSTAIGVSVAAQSHTHTVSQITDFPTLATVATSGDYDDLINKPSAGGLTALQTASLISIRF